MNNERIYYSHDAQVQAMHERTILITLFLALGLGVGVTLALLFAPASGKDTRDDLSKTMEQGLDNGYQSMESMVKHIDGELVELRKYVDERLKK